MICTCTKKATVQNVPFDFLPQLKRSSVDDEKETSLPCQDDWMDEWSQVILRTTCRQITSRAGGSSRDYFYITVDII